jgi:hypothetical protein
MLAPMRPMPTNAMVGGVMVENGGRLLVISNQ